VQSSRLKLALALLVCLAFPAFAAAQQRIAGTVTDNPHQFFTPVQYSPPRFLSGSMRVRF
jgi:ABC-type sugar transport system substrate-binding protein